MQWKDRSEDGRASQLEVVEEFRSFVRPSWRPILSEFCTNLTGITQVGDISPLYSLTKKRRPVVQEQVDAAPLFPEVLQSFQKFLVKHGLIDELTGERLVRFCWCSDGPFDVRDFVVKQCFISKVSYRLGALFLAVPFQPCLSRLKCRPGCKVTSWMFEPRFWTGYTLKNH